MAAKKLNKRAPTPKKKAVKKTTSTKKIGTKKSTTTTSSSKKKTVKKVEEIVQKVAIKRATAERMVASVESTELPDPISISCPSRFSLGDISEALPAYVKKDNGLECICTNIQEFRVEHSQAYELAIRELKENGYSSKLGEFVLGAYCDQAVEGSTNIDCERVYHVIFLVKSNESKKNKLVNIEVCLTSRPQASMLDRWVSINTELELHRDSTVEQAIKSKKC